MCRKSTAIPLNRRQTRTLGAAGRGRPPCTALPDEEQELKLRALFGGTAVTLGAAMLPMPALTAPAASAAISAPRAPMAAAVLPAIGRPDGGVSSTALS